jgi:hypothetical protein
MGPSPPFASLGRRAPSHQDDAHFTLLSDDHYTWLSDVLKFPLFCSFLDITASNRPSQSSRISLEYVYCVYWR